MKINMYENFEMFAVIKSLVLKQDTDELSGLKRISSLRANHFWTSVSICHPSFLRKT